MVEYAKSKAGLIESNCAYCNKIFYRTGIDWGWAIPDATRFGHKLYYCSWTCLRKDEMRLFRDNELRSEGKRVKAMALINLPKRIKSLEDDIARRQSRLKELKKATQHYERCQYALELRKEKLKEALCELSDTKKRYKELDKLGYIAKSRQKKEVS